MASHLLYLASTLKNTFDCSCSYFPRTKEGEADKRTDERLHDQYHCLSYSWFFPSFFSRKVFEYPALVGFNGPPVTLVNSLCGKSDWCLMRTGMPLKQPGCIWEIKGLRIYYWTPKLIRFFPQTHCLRGKKIVLIFSMLCGLI